MLALAAALALSQNPAPVKVLISVDMEGAAGLTHDDQVNPKGPDYAIGRRLMIGEANAAIRGAALGGATEVLVVDAHWSQINLVPDELLESVAVAREGKEATVPVTLFTGRPKPMGMMQGIDASFAAAVFVAYHPRAGTANGVLDHTWSSESIADVLVNGKSFGECGLNAALAGEFGVPVDFLSGDRAACEEARDLLGGIETVAVKEGIGRNAARTMLPGEARRAIEAGVKRGVERRREIRPLKVEGPVRLAVRFRNANQAFLASQVPGARLTGPEEVSAQAPNFLEAWRFFYAF
ncbi:MAG: M55 family metallopeptidase [Planctomycetota bacterium]